MTQRTCNVEGCDKAAPAKGGRMCNMHATRLRRTGTTDPGPRALVPFEQRFWRHVAQSAAEECCWPWQGKLRGGYGVVRRGSEFVSSHRAAWELTYGPIPDGKVIDHKCRNRACVNPAHLQLATVAENTQNHQGPRRDNKSGYRGIYWLPSMKKWGAQVRRGNQVERAFFDTPEEAAEAAVEMRNRMHTNNLLDRTA